MGQKSRSRTWNIREKKLVSLRKKLKAVSLQVPTPDMFHGIGYGRIPDLMTNGDVRAQAEVEGQPDFVTKLRVNSWDR